MGAIIRPATPADAAAIARVHVESWRTTYAGIPDAVLASLDVAERTERWREVLANEHTITFAAEQPGADLAPQVVGFAGGGRLREPVEGYTGELYAIYLLRESQRQGVGRAITRAVAAFVRDLDLSGMLVWVLEDNPAVSFYEHLGAVRVARKSIVIGGRELPEIALGWAQLDAILG